MVTNNVTVYQFEVGLDEDFADEVRFRVNVNNHVFINVIIKVQVQAKCTALFSSVRKKKKISDF